MGRAITKGFLAAVLLLAVPLVSLAAGLGRLTVLSPLGQPLNAEIEIVSLQPGEEEGLVARLASSEAFRQAGIEPNAVLSGARFSIERRDGRHVLKVTTSQPVNEPFLEFLVELQWNTGRLIREYTFLLDPVEYKPDAIAAAPATPSATAPKPQIDAKPIPPAAEPAKPATAPSAAATGPAYEVKPGDTLAGIARQHLAPGVSLDQMLMAIYRSNPDAFISENINLVRAGRILNIPAPEAAAIEQEEAHRLVQEHAGRFSQYRSRLAAAAPRTEAAGGTREATGRIESKPEAAPPAGSREDQVKLSKAEPGKQASPGARAARGDDLVARERALKEAQSRVAELEKNVADLQKLLELRNQQLAELEKRAKPGAAAVAPAKPAAEAPKPAAEAPKPAAEAPKPPADAQKPVAEAPKPAAEAPKPAAESPKPQPPKPAAEAPKAKPKPAPLPPEPSLIDEFLDNPLALGGLVAVILLLVGYGVWSWRRKKAGQARFQDSVLGAAGGAAITPSGSAPSQVSVSQSPVSGMEAEEVDPIAEADVYMAYGRDSQAEEILKEALQKDSNRVAIHAKLLEIYAGRRDARTFEQTALKLKTLTGGSGPEWQKAITLGRSIDPQNGLYGGAPSAPAAKPATGPSPVAPAAAAGAAAGAAGAAAAPTLDFDLGGGTTPAGSTLPDIPLEAQPSDKTAPPNLDFDLGAAEQPKPPATGEKDFTPEGTLIMESKSPESTLSGLDFDLDLSGPSDKTKPPAGPAKPAAPSTPAESSGMDFDLDLDLSGGDNKPQAQSAGEPAGIDLSSIDLDLSAPGESAAAGGNQDPKWQEVATKLDLAKAYEEMGDKDGARELLGEVVREGNATQKGQAEQMLAKLS